MNNIDEIKLDIVFGDEFNVKETSYLIGHNRDFSKYYLARKIDKSSNEVVEDTSEISFFNLILIEDEKYEAIEIVNNNGNYFTKLLLKALANLNIDLPSAIKKVELILKEIFDQVNIFKIRGTYGELLAMQLFALNPQEGDFSIYDFVSNAGNDVEVKTYSKVKNEVKVSLQQLFNNSDALFYFIELSESNKGISLLDLAKSVNAEKYERYAWIFKTNSRLIHKKFESNDWSSATAKKLNEGIKINSNVKNATFTFEPKTYK